MKDIMMKDLIEFKEKLRDTGSISKVETSMLIHSAMYWYSISKENIELFCATSSKYKS
jgi:hypothetical protein